MLLTDILQAETTQSIEQQIQSQLIGIILKRCSDCSKTLTTAYINQGVFLCHGNPTSATYRSSLINPFPTTNASQLVGIIQSWVSTSPSLVVDDRLVRVNPNCPTRIDCLDDDECASSNGPDPEVYERISHVLSACAARRLGQQICDL